MAFCVISKSVFGIVSPLNHETSYSIGFSISPDTLQGIFYAPSDYTVPLPFDRKITNLLAT